MGVCEPDGDGFQARFTITARNEIAVEGTGELVPFERPAPRPEEIDLHGLRTWRSQREPEERSRS